MKEVKKVFFASNLGLPFFELENGDVKRPILIYGKLYWMTEREIEIMENEKIASEKNKNWFQKLFS